MKAQMDPSAVSRTAGIEGANMFCGVCGSQQSTDSRWCSNCGASFPATMVQPGGSPAAATAAAAASTPDKPLAGDAPVAGIGDRAIAGILDMILMSALFPAVGMWAALRFGGVTGNGFELNGLPAFLTIAIVGIAGFLYLWLCEGVLGATLGKFMLNVRIRRAEGGAIGLGKSLIRNLLRIIDGIGVYLVAFLMATFSRRRQRLGDRIAGTVVVQADAGRAVRASAAILWAVCVLACLTTAFVFHAEARNPPPATAAAPLTVRPVAFQPRVRRAELGLDHTADYGIVGQAIEFYTDTPRIVCVWQTEGAPLTLPIKSVWIAEDVGNAAPPNYELAERSIAGADIGDFSITSPSNGWPVGKYRLDIYLGDKLARQVPFRIEQR
jgi:uncharacterized RDD family membrane protein YckC